MRITLNLASKPFIELRPLYARLRLWMAVLLVLAIPLWLLVKSQQRKAAVANAKLTSVQNDIQRLRDQQQNYQAMMRQPNNAAVLTQAAFLNQLFARKGFSWTAIMMDLETVLPGGVQVLNIDPTTDKVGNVTIRLRVNGQRDRAVDLVRNLEHSRRFLQPRIASETAETSNGNGQANFRPASGPTNVNFDVLAEYKPLPEKQISKDSNDAAATKEIPAKSATKGSGRAAGAKRAMPSTPKAATPRPGLKAPKAAGRMQ